MPDRDALKDEMLASHNEFRKLHAEHQDHERRLQELYQKTLLSQSDEVEQKRLKVRKLQLKDRMESILREQENSRVPV